MVLVFLAEGFEEIEAVASIDILRRAEIEVTIASLGGRLVRGAHGITIAADTEAASLSADTDFEAVLLPGGMPGTLNLEKSDIVRQFIKSAESRGKIIAAICAAPSILGRMGILDNAKATVFPGFEHNLPRFDADEYVVNHENKIITAKGAGAAADFALELVKVIKGEKISRAIGDSLCIPRI